MDPAVALVLICVIAFVWWLDMRKEREINGLKDRIEDLEMGRPVKIEDGPARSRNWRQDR